MTTTRLALAVCGATLLACATPAMADDARAQLTPDLIYEHCIAAGVGSQTEGVFMLPGGQRVTGSVLCTAEDLAATNARPARHGDDDDDHEGHRQGHGGDDEDDGPGFPFGA